MERVAHTMSGLGLLFIWGLVASNQGYALQIVRIFLIRKCKQIMAVVAQMSTAYHLTTPY